MGLCDHPLPICKENRLWQHQGPAISTFTISSQLSGHNGNHIEYRKRPLLLAVILHEGPPDSPRRQGSDHSCRGQKWG